MSTPAHRIDRVLENHDHCVATTPAGNMVHTAGLADKVAHGDKTVFQFKGNYEDQELTKYKSLQVKLHFPYTI